MRLLDHVTSVAPHHLLSATHTFPATQLYLLCRALPSLSDPSGWRMPLISKYILHSASLLLISLLRRSTPCHRTTATASHQTVPCRSIPLAGWLPTYRNPTQTPCHFSVSISTVRAGQTQFRYVCSWCSAVQCPRTRAREGTADRKCEYKCDCDVNPQGAISLALRTKR